MLSHFFNECIQLLYPIVQIDWNVLGLNYLLPDQINIDDMITCEDRICLLLPNRSDDYQMVEEYCLTRFGWENWLLPMFDSAKVFT